MWLLLALALAQADTVEDELRRAQNEYAYGNYPRAVEILKGVLYPMRLYSDAQVIGARRTLGLCYYLRDDKPNAELEFTKLLYLDPDHQLDPFSIAPPIIELFEKVRRRHEPELDVIRAQLRPTEEAGEAPRGIRRTVTITSDRYSELATLMPFGIGQFVNGDVGWGVVLAVVQAALLAGNIGSFFWLRGQDVEGRSGYRSEDAGKVQAAMALQFASALLLGATWSVGVFQARLKFIPEIKRRTVVDEPLVGGAVSLHVAF
jgi:hypothetical protein